MVAAAGCARVRSSARAGPVLKVRRVAGIVDGLNDLFVAHALGYDDAPTPAAGSPPGQRRGFCGAYAPRDPQGCEVIP